MSLLQQIKNDMFAAKKSGEKIKAILLNVLYSESAMIGKNDNSRETTDVETTSVIKKFIKNNSETLTLVQNDPIAVQLYQAELDILSHYLPKQLTHSELTVIITYLKSSGKNMGDIMKVLKTDYAGLYDGQVASNIAKSA